MRTSRITKNRLNGSSSACALESRTMLAAEFVHTDTWEETNFDDGSTNPFESKGSGRVENGKYVAGFYEDNYNGNRWGLGSELRSDVEISGQGYAGWHMTIPSDDFPDDKNTIVHQWFNYPDGADSFWGATLHLENNDLYLKHRHFKFDPEKILLKENLPTDQEIAFKSRIIPGNGTGKLVYMVDGEIVFDENDLIIGQGFDSDGKLTNGHVEQQIGQYAADVSGHEEGEERILLFDNISVLSNNDNALNFGRAWKMVDPG